MAQNLKHWLLERDNFSWAREHIPEQKWCQITKMFEGNRLRRQMVYVDAESGETIAAEGGEVVPVGRVYVAGYDLRNFCGIELPGLDEAMKATRKSRLAQRTTQVDSGTPGTPAVPARSDAASGAAR